MTPDPDEARELMGRELARREYQQSLFERVWQWFEDLFEEVTGAASGAGSLSVLAATVLALALVVLLLYVLPRVRRDRVTSGRDPAADIVERGVTAAELRARAEEALRQRRTEDAVVDAFRALCTRMVERAVLDPAPGSTAHELAIRLGELFPEQARALHAAAERFDAVRYGDHRATSDDALGVLALDELLRQARPLQPELPR